MLGYRSLEKIAPRIVNTTPRRYTSRCLPLPLPYYTWNSWSSRSIAARLGVVIFLCKSASLDDRWRGESWNARDSWTAGRQYVFNHTSTLPVRVERLQQLQPMANSTATARRQPSYCYVCMYTLRALPPGVGSRAFRNFGCISSANGAALCELKSAAALLRLRL